MTASPCSISIPCTDRALHHERRHNRRPLAVALALASGVLFTGLIIDNVQAADKGTAAARAMPSGQSKTGTKYTADADMQAVLDALAALHPKPIDTLDATEARKQPSPADAVKSVLTRQGRDTNPTALVPGVASKDTTVDGAAGTLPARIYTPAGAGPFPLIVYYHGGGWVIADKDTYDGGARGLAKEANAIVVSADYRRAPEAKFPAQHEDALAVYRWTLANAASLNGDPRRIALAGESAGGNLAVATAIAARSAGEQQPTHVIAVYPVAQVTDLDTPSYKDSEHAKPLNKAMMLMVCRQSDRAPRRQEGLAARSSSCRSEGPAPGHTHHAQSIRCARTAICSLLR